MIVKYLLDTDHISFLQRRCGSEFQYLAARIARHPTTDFALSIVSFHEQTLGAHSLINRAQKNSDTVRGYSLLSEIQQGFSIAPVLPFGAGEIAVFDDLRRQRVRVSTMDLRIAAIALSRALILLTRNVRDFSKVPGLTTEDWTV
ncbi:MAG: type II toxin-antitoxin system VapC family toxin [Phormidesmis sp.]